MTPIPQNLEELLDMVAPGILDAHDIKMGFLFSLIGGMKWHKSEKEIEDMSVSERRRYMDKEQFRTPSQINSLVIGNPSCGKSQVRGGILTT